jgi:acetylornithine deacetylase/succinyl-diaminopimelate desuccinylase-like protein
MKTNTLDPYLATLIGHRTITTDIEANNASLDYLENFFNDRGLYIQRYNFNGRGALVATTRKDSKTPKVMLGAHLDVVPGDDDQFTLREKDGKLYGRGVNDMKFAVASYMHVIDTLRDNLASYDLGVMLTIDEETGGFDGVDQLVKLGYRPSVCILPDGAENWEIEVLAKGVWHFKIISEGKPAHGSRPWDGESAIDKLLDILAAIRQNFSNDHGAADTLNIGMVNGGEASNQVASRATADLDIRFISKDAYKLIESMVSGVCAKYGARYETAVYGDPCINNLENPMIAPYRQSVIDIVGVEPQGVVAFGGSDARHFTSVDVPCIVSEPYAGGRHAADEWIDKKAYEQYHDVLIDYLNKVAHI